MSWEPIEEEEPQRNPLQAAGRQVARVAAKGVGGFVGGVGDLANLASVGLEKVGAISPESGQGFREKTLTSAKIREGLEEEYPSLKPENKIERFADDVFETIGSLGTGGPGKTAAFKILRKLGLSVGANLGKEVRDFVFRFYHQPKTSGPRGCKKVCKGGKSPASRSKCSEHESS